MIPAIMGAWALVLVAIAVRWPRQLLPAAILCAVFQGAAVVNAGGLGISPYYFTLTLIAARCPFVRVARSDVLGHTPGVRRIVKCAATLLLIGLGSAVVMPLLFAGWPVLSPRLSADDVAPLAFSTSNVGQAVYLLLNVLMLWYAAQTCRTADDARRLVRAFAFSGVVVIAFCGYQFIASVAGLPFPDDLLYSNEAYVMQNATAILDMPRICSTFTEPAGVASFLLPFLIFLAGTLERGQHRWRWSLLLLSTIACLMLLTSSTAYLGLAAIGACAIGRYLVLPFFHGRGNVKAAVAVAVVIVASVCAVVLSESLRDVFHKMVFEKQDSGSYEERTQADSHSMQLAERTWGLGVGLGSNRGSSFLPTMLSTIGVGGAATIAVLVFLLVQPAGDVSEARQLRPPLAAALLGSVGVLLISAPDLSIQSIWVLMALLVAVRAAAEGEHDHIAELTPDWPPRRGTIALAEGVATA